MTEERPDLSTVIHLREVKDDETLVQVLREAETSEERLREQIAQPVHTSYLALMGAEVVGGATLKWQGDESELIYMRYHQDPCKNGIYSEGS